MPPACGLAPPHCEDTNGQPPWKPSTSPSTLGTAASLAGVQTLPLWPWSALGGPSTNLLVSAQRSTYTPTCAAPAEAASVGMSAEGGGPRACGSRCQESQKSHCSGAQQATVTKVRAPARGSGVRRRDPPPDGSV